MFRRVMASAALLVGLALIPGPAAAASATVERASVDVQIAPMPIPPMSIPLCSFPVSVSAHIWGDYVYLTRANGSALEIDQLWEQDTLYGPHGAQLVSLPYRFSQQTTYDTQGNLVKSEASGGLGRYILPDGSTFWSVGRTDWTTKMGQFVINPDVGRLGDVAALCAAIA